MFLDGYIFGEPVTCHNKFSIGSKSTSLQVLSKDKCVQSCLQIDYKFAAINSSQCVCLDEIDNPNSSTRINCDIVCIENATKCTHQTVIFSTGLQSKLFINKLTN